MTPRPPVYYVVRKAVVIDNRLFANCNRRWHELLLPTFLSLCLGRPPPASSKTGGKLESGKRFAKLARNNSFRIKVSRSSPLEFCHCCSFCKGPAQSCHSGSQCIKYSRHQKPLTLGQNDAIFGDINKFRGEKH